MKITLVINKQKINLLINLYIIILASRTWFSAFGKVKINAL